MKHFILDGNYGRALGVFGIDVGEALRKAGLPEDALRHPAPTMTAQEYYAFMEAVGELAGREDAAVALASADGVEQFSPPIFASFCARDGRACIERLARYKPLVGPMEFILADGDGSLMVQLACPERERAMPAFLAQCEIAFLVNVLRAATKRDISPVGVMMLNPPEGTWFEEFLGCGVREGVRDEVTFADDDLAVPFYSRNDAMWGYFEPELGRRLSELDVDEGTSARVRSALVEALPTGEVGIDEIARRLGQSKRTLQRKLGEEGTTFQKQLNHVRELLAKRYLTTTSMRTDEIAFMLGYVEHNSFLRAFSSWTGVSPSEYRKRHDS